MTRLARIGWRPACALAVAALVVLTGRAVADEVAEELPPFELLMGEGFRIAGVERSLEDQGAILLFLQRQGDVFACRFEEGGDSASDYGSVRLCKPVAAASGFLEAWRAPRREKYRQLIDQVIGSECLFDPNVGLDAIVRSDAGAGLDIEQLRERLWRRLLDGGRFEIVETGGREYPFFQLEQVVEPETVCRDVDVEAEKKRLFERHKEVLRERLLEVLRSADACAMDAAVLDRELDSAWGRLDHQLGRTLFRGLIDAGVVAEEGARYRLVKGCE